MNDDTESRSGPEAEAQALKRQLNELRGAAMESAGAYYRALILANERRLFGDILVEYVEDRLADVAGAFALLCKG